MTWWQKIFGQDENGLDIEKDIKKSFDSAIKRGSGQQQFLVKKLVKQENGRKKLMFLPDEDDPIRLTRPMTQADITNLFNSDFGGGLYQIIATVPEEFEVWEYKIAGKERSPFYEEEIRDTPRNRGRPGRPNGGASDKISTIENLKELGLSDNVVKAITVATLAKELKIPTDDIFRGMENTDEPEKGMEEVIEKTAKDVLMNDQEFREALVKKKMEEMMGSSDDPNAQLLKMADTIKYLQGEPGILGGLGGSLAGILPAILSNPGALSQLSSMIGGEQPEQKEGAPASNDGMVKVNIDGKIVKMPKETYAALKNKKRESNELVLPLPNDVIEEIQPEEVRSEKPTLKQGGIPGMDQITNLLENVGTAEPETVAREIIIASGVNAQVSMVLDVIESTGFDLDKVEELLLSYLKENPAYKVVYESAMTPENREWFKKVMAEIKKLRENTNTPIEDDSIDLGEDDDDGITVGGVEI